jgi:hypothetical protein
MTAETPVVPLRIYYRPEEDLFLLLTVENVQVETTDLQAQSLDRSDPRYVELKALGNIMTEHYKSASARI